MNNTTTLHFESEEQRLRFEQWLEDQGIPEGWDLVAIEDGHYDVRRTE